MEQLVQYIRFYYCKSQGISFKREMKGNKIPYSSYNPFLHNIVRDCFLVVIAHLVWIILATILTCSLLGAAYNAKSFHLTSDLSLPSIVGHGVWLISVTLVEKSLATLSTGWLWAGLFFILILLVSITSVFGYIEVN